MIQVPLLGTTGRLQGPAQATQVPAIGGSEPGQILEDRDSLGRFSALLQRMRQRVGGLGADRSRGGVVTDRFPAASQSLQDLGQVVVDPDVDRMTPLGPTQHVFGRGRVSGLV